MFWRPPPQAAAIQGGEKKTGKSTEKLENNGFTMTKPCFLTKAIPAFLVVFLCPPPQASAIQGGVKDTEKNKAKLEKEVLPW